MRCVNLQGTSKNKLYTNRSYLLRINCIKSKYKNTKMERIEKQNFLMLQ